MAQQFKLKNKANNKTFLFKTVSDVRNRISQPSNTISLINSNWANALQFKLFGQQRTLQLRFVLYDDGTDLSEGTHSATVTDIDQQVRYLQEEVYTSQFDAEFELYSSSPALARYFSDTGVILELEFEETRGPMKIIQGSITFAFGRVNPLG